MQEMLHVVESILGSHDQAQNLTLGQISLRATLIYLSGWIMLRAGEHRFLGKNTAFDVILGFIFGSLLSRAINGSGPFFETIAAALVLVLLHWLFMRLSFHSDRVGDIINGRARRLVNDGEVAWDQMREAGISLRVLEQNLRMNGSVRKPDEVSQAIYESSGQISVIPRQKEYRVIEVDVRDGIQTVRIELG